MRQQNTLLAHYVAASSYCGGSHPPGFAWATSVVRHGGVVSDRYHLQPSHREAFDCRLHNRKMFVHPESKRLDGFLFLMTILFIPSVLNVSWLFTNIYTISFCIKFQVCLKHE